MDLSKTYPEITAWAKTRKEIYGLKAELSDPETFEKADRACWQKINSIFCRPLAMGLYYMPKTYSVWPAYWHDHVLREYMTGKNCAIAGPRRRGKSKTAQLFQMYKMLTLDWVRSIHVCLSPELVTEHSQFIITELSENKRLQEAFNIKPGKIQRSEHFEVNIGKAHRTKITFEWFTRDGRPRGTGNNGVLVDDIDDNRDTPYVMEKYYNHIHAAIMGSMEDYEGVKAQMLICGNFTGRHCCMRKFQDNDAVSHPNSWVVMVVPAREEGKTQDITKVPTGESVWPEKFSTKDTNDTIAKMNMTKMKSGDMELQNKFADTSDLIWFAEMFEKRWDVLPPKWQAEYRVYIDSSQKVTEAGDEWAIGTMGKVLTGPRKGEIMLIEAHLAALQPDDAANIVIDQFIGNGSPQMPQCSVVKLESKTNKGIDPFLQLVRLKAQLRGVYIPTEELVPGGVDKRTRSQAAAPVGRSGALTVPPVIAPHMKRVIDQLCDFTGRSDPSMKAVDDGHDMVVWGINDLRKVEQAGFEGCTSLKVKNRLRGVA